MSQELITIEAFPREVVSKQYNKELRAEGKIPAILLEKGKSTPLSLNAKFLSRAWTGGKKFNMKLGVNSGCTDSRIAIERCQAHGYSCGSYS